NPLRPGRPALTRGGAPLRACENTSPGLTRIFPIEARVLPPDQEALDATGFQSDFAPRKHPQLRDRCSRSAAESAQNIAVPRMASKKPAVVDRRRPCA